MPEKRHKSVALVVDDEQPWLKMSRKVLEKFGMDVICTYSGQKALTIAADSVPDVIVLDLLMPGMNGFDVLKKLKDNPRTDSIPVIVHTSTNSGRYKKRCYSLGAAGYLDKTFTEEKLTEEVEKHLRKGGNNEKP